MKTGYLGDISGPGCDPDVHDTEASAGVSEPRDQPTPQSAHTPEPWLADERCVYALTQDGWHKGAPIMVNRFYAGIQRGHESTPEELEANARRIVACVNACINVDNDGLFELQKEGGLSGLLDLAAEGVETVRALKAQRDAIERQRDALAEALREFVRLDEESKLSATDGGELVSALNDAERALAKLK